MKNAPDDWNAATVYNWKADLGSYITNALSSMRRPGESRVWFNYPGQYGADSPISSHQPIKTIQQVEGPTGNPTWVMTQQTYNALGNPLMSTDELGRTLRSNYATNGIDVTSIQTLNSQGTWVTLRSYGGYSNHLPGTITEASGRTIAVTRNAKGQPTLIDLKKGTLSEKTRLTYDSDGIGIPDGLPGYLMKVEKTSPASASLWVTTEEFTYFEGQVATHKDSTDYVQSFAFDDLGRLAQITHPDSSTEAYSYHFLDNDGVKDRAGRWSITFHNAGRQPIASVDPAGMITQYQWCSCGSLSTLIDASGQKTSWTRDLRGRVTEKIRADTLTKTTFTYEPFSGRLATVTHPNQQGSGAPTVTYRYNLDGRLYQEDYQDNSLDVTYDYHFSGNQWDSLGRLWKVTDGIGVHTFSYIGYSSSSATAGEGMLDRVNGPFTNDTLDYNYDWQDRPYLHTVLSSGGSTLRQQTSTWDSLSRPKTVVNALGTFTFGYNTSLAKPDSVAGPNGLLTSFTYTASTQPGYSGNRLASISHTRSGVPVSSHSFTYDSPGHITNWEQEASGQTPLTWRYGYNLRDELVSAEKFETANPNTVLDRQAWALDNAGNWLSHTTTAMGNHIETRTHDALNRLVQRGGGGTTAIEGTVSEDSSVLVNGQPAEARVAPAGNGALVRFRKVIPSRREPTTSPSLPQMPPSRPPPRPGSSTQRQTNATPTTTPMAICWRTAILIGILNLATVVMRGFLNGTPKTG
jgi:YD repeat-containing protein